MFTKRLAAVAIVATLASAIIAVPASAQTATEHTAENGTVESRADGTSIAITVFQPGGSGVDAQVPVLLHSHGWGGTRSTSVAAMEPYLDAGFGVVSIDQRGHGQSGGQANVQDPELETEDIKSVIDHVASLDWVLKDTDDGGAVIADDPVLGALGGSYGGGYQTMTALDEIADEGRTRFNALAPQITWYDLNESLAPQKVVRTSWVTVLYAAGARMLPPYIHEAFAWGASTGQWPDGTLFGEPAPGVPDLDSEFHKHGPVYFAEQGIKIDVPVLQRQGSSDNLFNLNQGLHIFHEAVTDDARDQSYFVAYNGGHALPNVLPPGDGMSVELGGGSDACSVDEAGWTQLTIDFYKRVFSGESTDGLLPSRYNFTTADGSNCLHVDHLGEIASAEVDLPTGTVATPTAAGAPIHLPIAEGPITVSGIPTLSGLATAVGLDSRAFFGLSVGTTPVDARVVQNNLMPLREVLPVVEEAFDIELPGVAVEVPEGQTLYLTISPVSDIYFGHGSRTPGTFVLSDLAVSLPGSVEPGGDPDDPKSPNQRACEKTEGKGNGNGPKHCRDE